jgi:hypothetical protein
MVKLDNIVGAGFEPARLHVASDVSTTALAFEKFRKELKLQRCSFDRVTATVFERRANSQSFTGIKRRRISVSSSIVM